MGILLNELLKLECFKKSRLAAGSLEKAPICVEGITIIEAPDIADWIKGGEMLLTSFYPIASDINAQKSLILKLSEKGAAALIVKVSRFLQEIPQEIIETANDLDFPLIEIPGDIKYIDIMYPVMAELFNNQLNRLNYYRKCHEEFTELSMKMKGLDCIADSLRAMIGNPVIIYDSDFQPIAATEEGYSDFMLLDDGIQVLKEEKFFYYRQRISIPTLNYIETTRVTIPIKVINQIKAYLCVVEVNNMLEDLDFIAIESASTTVFLEALKELAVEEVELKYKGDFIDDLINGKFESQQAAHNRARIFGFDLMKPYIIVLIRMSNYENYIDIKSGAAEKIHQLKNMVKRHIDNTIFNYSSDYIVVNKSDDYIILWQCKKDEKDAGRVYGEIKQFAEALQRQMMKEDKSIDLSIGIGSIANSAAEIKSSYDEALDSVSYGNIIYGRGSVAAFDELGIYKLLCKYEDKEALKAFIHPALIRLYEYDTNKNNELVSTLEMYLKCNLNAVKTAEELFVHYKTILYRLNRIKEITDLDFYDREHRLELEVGLKIMHILNKAF